MILPINHWVFSEACFCTNNVYRPKLKGIARNRYFFFFDYINGEKRYEKASKMHPNINKALKKSFV